MWKKFKDLGCESTWTLTTGADTILGAGNNDTISAILGTGATLASFDSINGGAGTDTLNIADTTAAVFALPPSSSFSNLENVNLSRASGAGAGTQAFTITNTTFGTGIKTLSVNDASTGTAGIGSVTLNSATAVSVVGAGTAFTSVDITDTSTTAASTGSTLTTVTVTKDAGVATLTGNAINTVNLNAVAGLTTVTAAAGTRALTVNASGTTTQGGLTDATATSATLNISGAQAFGALTTAKATSVTVNATAAASETITAAIATSLTLGGTALNTVTLTGNNALSTIAVTGSGGVTVDASAVTTLTSVDTSASTAAAPTSGVLTGANTFTLATTTAFTGGAGQDVLLAEGATTKAIAMGAGNDSVALTVTALGVGGSIDGGEGTDTLTLAAVDAATLSAAGAVQTAFKAAVTNFETLTLQAVGVNTRVVDATGFGTFHTVNVTGNAAASNLTINNLVSGDTVKITGSNVGATTTTGGTLGAGVDDTLNITLSNGTGAAVAFGTIATPNVENVIFKMTDSQTTPVGYLNTIAALTDAALHTLTVTGNSGLNVGTLTGATALTSFNASGVTGAAGVSVISDALQFASTFVGSSGTGSDTINASAALAAVTISTTATGANTLTGSSTVANTITGGAGADTIVGGSGVDAIVGGSGADIITGAGGKDVLTLGVGADIVRYETIATSAGANGAQMDRITDFVAGTDKINFAQGALSLTGVTTDGTGDAVATMGAVVANATSVATAAEVYAALAAYTTLTASAALGTATVAQVYTFANGAAAGTYLVINDATVGFQGATDVVINITGVSGTVSAADFTFTL